MQAKLFPHPLNQPIQKMTRSPTNGKSSRKALTEKPAATSNKRHLRSQVAQRIRRAQQFPLRRLRNLAPIVCSSRFVTAKAARAKTTFHFSCIKIPKLQVMFSTQTQTQPRAHSKTVIHLGDTIYRTPDRAAAGG